MAKLVKVTAGLRQCKAMASRVGKKQELRRERDVTRVQGW
jgi:hypothetical protein